MPLSRGDHDVPSHLSTVPPAPTAQTLFASLPQMLLNDRPRGGYVQHQPVSLQFPASTFPFTITGRFTETVQVFVIP